ncbi:MerR family transcriptional regulator [Sutcliffiella halmapala]|uniref:MerR family transcriptional regulator n=1 Tax=Sutcliffiella halmapala TaxID=79882 RepID=UPI000995BFDA|nr:MerR family transcriptional regulator [Sutcliffiella halmapala]
MLKIGEFSKVSGLSIHTLYHYESLGILEPCHVDPRTNYRYYEAAQLVTMNKVLALKDAGFSLTEIANFLEDAPVNQQLLNMLESKADSLEKLLEAEANRLERLRTNIFLIKNGGLPMTNDISIKKVEPILVATVRDVCEKNSKDQFDQLCENLWGRVNEYIDQSAVKRTIPCMTLYHSGLYIHTDAAIDIEVAEPITKVIPESADVLVYELPAIEKMACVVHQGPFSTIGNTSRRMFQWIAENGYTVCGPVREIYHKGDWMTDDVNEYVTELQVPVS